MELVFAGEVVEGFAADAVRRTLSARLKLDERRLNRLFNGKPIVIKRGLPAEVGRQWVAQFQAMGARLHLRAEAPMAAPTAPEPPAASEPGAAAAAAELQLVPIERPAAPRPEAPLPGPAMDPPALPSQDGAASPAAAPGAVLPGPAPAVPYLPSSDGLYEDEPLFGLSFRGRMGRVNYLLASLVLLLAWKWASVLLPWVPGAVAGVVSVAALVVGVVWSVRVSVLRLHDVGLSGPWVLGCFVPGLGQLANLLLLVWPGQRDTNPYGDPPVPASGFAVLVAVMALAITWLITIVWLGWLLGLSGPR